MTITLPLRVVEHHLTDAEIEKRVEEELDEYLRVNSIPPHQTESDVAEDIQAAIDPVVFRVVDADDRVVAEAGVIEEALVAAAFDYGRPQRPTSSAPAESDIDMIRGMSLNLLSTVARADHLIEASGLPFMRNLMVYDRIGRLARGLVRYLRREHGDPQDDSFRDCLRCAIDTAPTELVNDLRNLLTKYDRAREDS